MKDLLKSEANGKLGYKYAIITEGHTVRAYNSGALVPEAKGSEKGNHDY